jgi:hypothetical protein
MHSILLFKPDERPFEVAVIERVFQSEPGFSDVRFNEPGGAHIEAEFVLGDDRTIARLATTSTRSRCLERQTQHFRLP